jgi:hypothetical protein
MEKEYSKYSVEENSSKSKKLTGLRKIIFLGSIVGGSLAIGGCSALPYLLLPPQPPRPQHPQHPQHQYYYHPSPPRATPNHYHYYYPPPKSSPRAHPRR